MIITLTMNPALDRTVSLPEPLAVGDVQPATSIREDAAGKGVNVAHVLTAAGDEVRAVLPLDPTDPYGALLTGVERVVVPITGHARANLTITDPAGETTKLNLPGPRLGPSAADALIDAVVTASEGTTWLALCGSLPPGAGDDFYVRVIEAVRARLETPPLIAVDTSGPVLTHTVAHGRPDLIKPNEVELAELAGVAVTSDLAEVAAAARVVVPAQAAAALVTLGGAGALLVDASGVQHAAIPPNVRVRSTVGAGDSSLAGYLHAHVAGAASGEALVSAVRHGSATASLPGTRLASPGDLPTGDVALSRLP